MAAALQVLHLPAQLAVLPVSLALAQPAGPAAVIGLQWLSRRGCGRTASLEAGERAERQSASLHHAPAALASGRPVPSLPQVASSSSVPQPPHWLPSQRLIALAG